MKTCRISELYEGVNDDGIYDFGPWARILMSVIRDEPNTGKVEIIEKVKRQIAGNRDSCAQNESKIPNFWESVIEQLRINDYLRVRYVAFGEEKEEATLELSRIGRQWLRSPESAKLELEATGLMYVFFRQKHNTPIARNKSESESDVDSDYQTKATNSPSGFEMEGRLVGIDTFYGNEYDDYDPDDSTSSSEDEENADSPNENENDDGNDSDVMYIGTVPTIVAATISISDDDDDEPKAKKFKLSAH